MQQLQTITHLHGTKEPLKLLKKKKKSTKDKHQETKIYITPGLP